MEDPSSFVKPEELERHRTERAENGFSWYDWINFDSYLTWVIIQGLEKFKEEGHGYPGNVTVEEWAEILDKIIAGFKAHHELSELSTKPRDMSYANWCEPLMKRWDEGSKLFIEYYGSLWD